MVQMLSRFRHTLGAVAGCLALIVIAGGSVGTVSAQTQPPAISGTVPLADLMEANTLPDIIQGKGDAKVTIIEYASLTCPHCATFHNSTLPKLKADYIDTGKVRFIYRNFPFDPAAVGTSMLAVCAGEARFNEIVGLFFKEQEAWTAAKAPETAVLGLWKGAGFTQESFDTCLQNQKIYDAVMSVRQRAYEKFGVDSTPTLFVNGARYRGALTPEQMEAVLKPLLAESK